MNKTRIAKTFYEILKFNPYHDRRGRFAEKGGFMASGFTGDRDRQAVTFSANPNTRAGAMAIARESATAHETIGRAYGKTTIPPKQTKPQTSIKPIQKPTKEENPLYPKKIAGVERGKPMSFDEANHGTTNPGFNKGGKYRINCQTCVVANEARRRGYDVTARPKDTKEAELLAHNTRKAWIDPKTGKEPELMSGCKDITTPKKALEYLESNLKQGERYNLSHSWKGRGHSGHIVNVFKDNSGKIRIYDPQSGQLMADKEVNSYLNKIKYKTSLYGRKYNLGISVLRVDNLQFNTEIVDKILEKGA